MALRSRRKWALGATLLVLPLVALGGASLLQVRPDSKTSKALVERMVGYDLACEAPPPASPAASGGMRVANFVPKKLVRSARVTLEIQDYRAFEASLRPLAERYGYVASLKLQKEGDGTHRAEMMFRIRADHFDRAMEEFKRLGTVRREEVRTEDVTHAYLDLEIRKANKGVEASRLRALITTRAGKLSDVIEAERALSEVTEELERMEVQKRTYDQEAAFSVLNAEVYETPKAAGSPSLWDPLRQAVRDAREGFLSSLAFVVLVGLVLLPWGALVGLIAGVWRWKRRRRLAEDTTSEAAL